MKGWINLGLLRIYWRKDDWAGLDYKHRMIAWTGRNSTPRSIIL